MPRLRVLEAADNKIASWPEELGGLVELHTLNLGNNGLKSLAGTELVSRKRMWCPTTTLYSSASLRVSGIPICLPLSFLFALVFPSFPTHLLYCFTLVCLFLFSAFFPCRYLQSLVTAATRPRTSRKWAPSKLQGTLLDAVLAVPVGIAHA